MGVETVQEALCVTLFEQEECAAGIIPHTEIRSILTLGQPHNPKPPLP